METLAVRYVGHSTMLIEVGGMKLLTDPVLRGSLAHLRRVVPLPDIAGLRQIDAVLLSHLHHDHLDLPSLRLLPSETKVIVPEGAGSFVRRAGFPNVVELGRGSGCDLGPLRIQATEAVHSGRRLPFGPTAEPVGYIVESGRRVAYFAGDTALFDGMTDLPSEMDVAMIPVWGWGPNLRGGHLDPNGAAEAVARFRPRVAIPVHWGTLWPRGLVGFRSSRLTEPPIEFAARVAASGVATETVILQPGERWELETSLD